MTTRKTIALCLEYPLAWRGGVSVLVETLLAGFKDRYNLVLVSPDKPEDIQIQPIIAHVKWDPAATSPKTARALAEELIRRRVDLAHFHLGGNFGWGNRFVGHCPIPYLNRRGVKVYSTVHSVVSPLDGYCGPQKPLWFKLALFPIAWAGKMHALYHVEKEIAVSCHNMKKLRRWYWPLSKKFLRIYHSRLREAPANETPSRESLILNVGHLAWRKGQLVLAEAFARIAHKHPAWKLNLVGPWLELDIAEKIRAIAKTHHLEERILLPGEQSNAMDSMRRAGIYAQSSYQEALGLALQEAMFLGCPAIGTRVGGIPELIESGKTGLLVEPGDPAAMAQALDVLMGDAALREKFGRAGPASIIEKGMTANQMVANHINLYESIFHGR